MDSSKRLISIDFLKAISIFGVVFIHTRNGNIITESISEMFRISVPIFIIFFAYFLEKSLSKTNSSKEYLLILRNRFKVLFLPYAFFTILYFFVLNDISTIHLHDLITGYWTGYGWPGQYFFIILFQLILLFLFIQKIANLRKFYIYFFFTLSLLIYFIVTYFFWSIPLISMISDRIFIYWIPYVLVGILLYRNREYFALLSNGYMVLFSIVIIPFEFLLLSKLDITHSPYIIPTVLLASLLVSNYFIAKQNDIELFMSIGIKKTSIYVSKRSLGIFVLNPLVIFLMQKFNVPYYQINNVFVDSFLNLLFTIIVFGCTLLVIAILEKTFMKRLVVN